MPVAILRVPMTRTMRQATRCLGFGLCTTLRDTAHAARLAAVVARNVAIDMLRRRRQTNISGDEVHTSWLLQQKPDSATPESQIEWKEDEQWLRQRIEQLPPREMQVMHLR